MANTLVALMAALGSAAWLYALMMKRTGSNTKNSLIIAGVAGVIVFFVVWSVLVLITDALE